MHATQKYFISASADKHGISLIFLLDFVLLRYVVHLIQKGSLWQYLCDAALVSEVGFLITLLGVILLCHVMDR